MNRTKNTETPPQVQKWKIQFKYQMRANREKKKDRPTGKVEFIGPTAGRVALRVVTNTRLADTATWRDVKRASSQSGQVGQSPHKVQPHTTAIVVLYFFFFGGAPLLY